MDILKIIKARKSIRRYQNKPISKRILDKVIAAGIWGPSIPSFLRIQPWRFVVITRKKQIRDIAKIMLLKSQKAGAGVNILLRSAANIVSNAPAIVAIYNSGEMNRLKGRFKAVAANFSMVLDNAELSAISAAIQNMILESESQKIGSCWLDMPLYCEQEINRMLKTKDKLVAFLTLGYPAEAGKRSPRKPVSETVKYLI